ncbi:MAG: ATP-dependent RNA helicase [Treponemataceae bacterium]|nr:ATP-dependent RNA helicase [Spirochaetales bacterium]MDY6031569.1 ATP-dependent RNA helicase [Treponemataceae bacterium]
MKFKELPVYQHKDVILDAIKNNQVIVVQSPTGSGKTTQLPIILHEAGYSQSGIIAVTQPRRIAALSVSEFISKQLGTAYPGLVGYKMRFEDKTDETTKIKIMTDGILLQEMKLDPWMSKYSVIIVDEAHERSLNIDFVLGLLKRVLEARPEFKVIVSSATMNTQVFSDYFNKCPIVTIDTITYPVSVIYDPPQIPASTSSLNAEDCLLTKIEQTVSRILNNKSDGDILIFLPGEKVIKDCMSRLYKSHFSRKIHIIPLYGRLSKEEQEKVFDDTPFGKKKVVISTNIAETSVTIPGITSVIDSGLAKLNFYNPRTFTSSLNETTISKASCNQRKGRAGRIQEGSCYRLYSRKDFETRTMFTLEEIYRTDLSEVVLRMSELGITDFEKFDFISPPGREGIISAVETLNLLGALEADNTLSKIGKLMVAFPLEPRLSRIIVEAILHYPDVIEETIIATSFLSAQNPFILPPGEELSARASHKRWADDNGDFVSYLRLYDAFINQKDTESFCEKNYLDHRVMMEIKNIVEQLEIIVSEDLGVPVISGGKRQNYLNCIACGMIQFVCIKSGRESYRSLTADNISIHPGSCMCKTNVMYIVAGEIVKTSRMFAMSVSPLSSKNLQAINPELERQLLSLSKNRKEEKLSERKQIREKMRDEDKRNKNKIDADENCISFGGQTFAVKTRKGKKVVQLKYENYREALKNINIEKWNEDSLLLQLSKMKATMKLAGYEIFSGEKLSSIFDATRFVDFNILSEKDWNRKKNYNFYENFDELTDALKNLNRIVVAKEKKKELGFVCLFNDGNGTFWFKVSRGLTTAAFESLKSLDYLADLCSQNEKECNVLGEKYTMLKDMIS